MSNSNESTHETVYPRLHYSSTTGCGLRQTSDDYLLDLKTEITCMCSLGDDSRVGHRISLGEIEATLIQLGTALNEGFPFYELFDDSQDIHHLGSALFEADYDEHAKPVRERFPDAFTRQDILYIRSLSIRPQARGQRLGASALHRFVTDWEGACSLIAIEPLPMQFWPGIRHEDHWKTLSLNDFRDEREDATAKLRNLFQGLGFRQIASLRYMLLCPVYRQAPLEELALEDSLSLSKEAVEELR